MSGAGGPESPSSLSGSEVPAAESTCREDAHPPAIKANSAKNNDISAILPRLRPLPA